MMRKNLLAASLFVTMILGFAGVASAKTITIYPSNHPNHQVNIRNGNCTVDGQAGTVVVVAGGGEACAITTNSVAPNPNTGSGAEAQSSQEAQQPKQKKK